MGHGEQLSLPRTRRGRGRVLIAVDTNVLVHAHRRDSGLHRAAKDAITKLAKTRRPWAIPLHCLVEFYGIVTHPRVWKTPSTPAQAEDQIRAWTEVRTLNVLGDDGATLEHLLDTLLRARVVGPKVHDARIAAVCRAHGVSELWSIDRDFSRFPELRTRNPLIPAS